MKSFFLLLLASSLLYFSFLPKAHAIPSFAHQTGQTCIACHAGGQFPELTAYGRLFKLTGYTIGKSVNPFSIMAVGSWTATQKNTDASGVELSPQDRQLILDYVSIFAAGKVTDTMGLFAQFTYQTNDPKTNFGHFSSDNFDFRYSNHNISENKDILWGLTFNNNPSVQDVWNSTPAWGYPYVSTTQGAFGGLPVATLLEGTLSQQVAGLGGYFYLNQNYYFELTGYGTAEGPFSIFSVGSKRGDPNYPLTFLSGIAPYLRLAYSQEVNAHNFMIGVLGMEAKIRPLDTANQPVSGQGTVDYRDIGFDGEYQYLDSIHTLTAQFRFIHETIDDQSTMKFSGYSEKATLDSLNIKLSYIYQATYGVSLAYLSIVGSDDALYAGGHSLSPTPTIGSASSSPNTSLWIPELFWLASPNIRVGVQHNFFSKYLGATTNYDGAERNAADNNTTFAYLWAAF